MDIENTNVDTQQNLVEREKCKGKAYMGAIIGGIVGLTFLIRWLVNTYTDKEIL